MIAAVDIALRASVVVLAALAVSAALRRRSAALRHSILAAGIVASALVAPLGRALPAWDVPFPSPRPVDFGKATIGIPPPVQAPAKTSPAPADADVVKNEREIPVDVMLNALWMFGIVVATTLMAIRFDRLARVARNATEVTEHRWIETSDSLRRQLCVRQRVSILKSDRPGLIGTYGRRRPRVLLPPDCDSWSDERIRIVLGHELAHIRRGDWSVQVAAEAVRAVFWYNPLFWIACARLRAEGEHACDDAILDAGVPAPDYAAHLLAIARVYRPRLGGDALVPMARPSTLERRIAAMLNTTLADRRPTRRAFAIALVAIAGITLAAASFRAAAQTEPRPLTGTVYD
ncbi:MAG: M56 family metallopeptidase, partial [Vicinamibacterales bacterium]